MHSTLIFKHILEHCCTEKFAFEPKKMEKYNKENERATKKQAKYIYNPKSVYGDRNTFNVFVSVYVEAKISKWIFLPKQIKSRN